MTRISPSLTSSSLALGSALLLAGLLHGCSGSGASGDANVVVAGDVPIVYVKRADSLRLNPTDAESFAAGGDLMLREKSSPSAPEHNLTQQFTQGNGDASDPEVSYDGKKIVFAMRCPSSNTSKIGDLPACTDHWNIWEYDLTNATGFTDGTYRRLTASVQDDDVDPVYLPAGGGYVFSSNRQTKSHLNQALGRSYYALDEYERQRVFNLHTMDAAGGSITQISFNQSHDRNPVIRPNGDVMFSRWDHVADRNHFKIFRMKPDGTDMFVLYGAHSEGNTFLNPRDMDPAGAYAGQLVSDQMPLQRSSEGGALVMIDAANYSEQNTPANSSVPAIGGQKQITAQVLNDDRGFSRYGRVTTPYPLWDGTDRILVAYKPCEVTKNNVVVSCATLTDAEVARLQSDRTDEEIAADSVQDDVPPHYAIYMFDPRQQTWLNVASPPAGFMYTDPVALLARAEPHAVEPTNVDADLAARNLGLLEVRSVYDTDGLGRMGDPMLAAADLNAGCSQAIPKTTPTDSQDTRAQVADLKRMKDPADTAYRCSPAYFVRAFRAVAPPDNTTGLRSAIGETNFEPQQILGYAPIEPDGSFKLLVPADTPIGLSIVDAQGRAYQSHTNWIQVRPGERRTCDGCHSPRRGASLNSGDVVNFLPATWLGSMASAHLSGETMASTRTRLDPTALNLLADLLSHDVWADTAQNVQAKAAFALRYTGNANAADDLATAVPANGIINYPDHIQPLWSRSRGSGGANTCTNCHNASATLDLTATVAGSGRLASYEHLLLGAPLLDPATGLPQTELDDGEPVVMRQPARVFNRADESQVNGLARSSRLMEILAGQTLMSDATARSLYATPGGTAPDHSTMLNAAEKRLLAEWMDLGGKYYNDPFDANSGVRSISGLSQTVFVQQILPILNTSCATYCHMSIGAKAGTHFKDNRFVLTGNPDGDYAVTLTMINDTCQAAANPLLTRPSTVPHPAGAGTQTQAVLPAGGTAYNTLLKWISSGCSGS